MVLTLLLLGALALLAFNAVPTRKRQPVRIRSNDEHRRP